MIARMQELYELLEKYNYHYHSLNESLISDYEYDYLMQELIELEAKYPQDKKNNSITEKVGNVIIDKFKKVNHKSPMLSLNNAFSYEDLIEYDNRVQKTLNSNDYTYVVELKIDGIAISLQYDNQLIQAVTRGNGEIGEDVTHNVQTIQKLPKNIDENIEVRGEIYISKNNFEQVKINEKTEYANPRNLASGTIRQLDNKIAKNRMLDIFVYGLIDYQKYNHQTYYESMQFLKNKGFIINEELKVFNNIKEVYDYIKVITTKRNEYNYEIDGIVIKINEYDNQKKIGYTSKYPKWAIAYKFSSSEAQTKLKDIIYTVGRTGKITPNAVLEPVHLMGSKISRATLHNEDYIKEKDIRIGDEVIIIKSGDIIPRVESVVLDNKHNSYQVTNFIEHCPECNEKLIKSEKDYYCNNPQCKAKSIEKIIYFVSQKAMNIQGLGNKIIEKLFLANIIEDFVDIYDLNFEKLYKLDGFKEKSIQNILNSIETSKKVELINFLTALGISNTGIETSKIIAKQFSNIQELYHLNLDELIELDGIGEITAMNIVQYFNEQNNIEKIEYLISKGLEINNSYFAINEIQEEINDNVYSKTFVITGSFENYKRTDLKDQIEKMGGKVTTSISKNTDFLICGIKPGSKLEKADKLNVSIIYENEIQTLLKK